VGDSFISECVNLFHYLDRIFLSFLRVFILYSSISVLAKSLCEIQPLVLLSNNPEIKTGNVNAGNSGMSLHDITPIFTLAQEGQLDSIITKLQEALQNNEIHDISMSSVMQLYEYKLAAMGHSERVLQVGFCLKLGLLS
jgi:hypothetical protein